MTDGPRFLTLNDVAEVLNTSLAQVSALVQRGEIRALKIGDELGGHIMAGHVDGLATLVARDDLADMARFLLRAPAELAPFIAPKGSVALDGVSLTVNEVKDATFSVLIIPHTLKVTTLGKLAVGEEVNLEVDLMARYAARLLEGRGLARLTGPPMRFMSTATAISWRWCAGSRAGHLTALSSA